jgi:hypothetical protein
MSDSAFLVEFKAFTDIVKPDVKDKAGFCSAEAAEDIAIGFPVCIRRSDGKAIKADASIYIKSDVAGIAMHDAMTGLSCTIGKGRLVLTDWNSIAGSLHLSSGDSYFLAEGGGLTNAPPVGITGVSIVYVGFAESNNALIIQPLKSILQ